MSLYALFKSKGPSGFSYGSTAEDVTAGLSLTGKTVLVVPAAIRGLGLETMRVLAARGAPCSSSTARTEAKAKAAAVQAGDPYDFQSGLRTGRSRLGARLRRNRARLGRAARRHHRQRRHHGPAEA